jgi:hemophore-related protein
MQALHDYNVDHWAQFNASPIAQSYLRQFLASPPPRRAQMAAQIQAMPQAAAYFNDVTAVAATCSGYGG